MFLFLLVPFFALRAETLQFGLVFATTFEAGGNLPPGHGYALQTAVIANLGTTAFKPADIVYLSALNASNAPAPPVAGAINGFSSSLVLEPGTAAGYVNGDAGIALSLSFLQGIFPTVTSLIMTDMTLDTTFENPLDSGVIFGSTESIVGYTASIDAATAAFTTTFTTGSPQLSPGITSMSLGSIASSIVEVPVPVPEPHAYGVELLVGMGLMLALRKSWGRAA